MRQMLGFNNTIKIALFISWSSATFVQANPFYAINDVAHYEKTTYSVPTTSGARYDIAAHRWSNNNRQLVVMSHGYTDNCAYLKPLQHWFLAKNFDVLCLELPGHGRSSGPVADIEHMKDYYDIYRKIFPQIFTQKNICPVFFGHSTGNVGMIEYLMAKEEHRFHAIILTTPLIRSHLWHLSKFGKTLSLNLIKKIKRRSLSGRAPEYQMLRKLDPAPIDYVPMSWFQRLIEWNKLLAKDPRISHEKIEVIFADDDKVIDTRYNRRFIQKHFPKANISTIPKAGHILHYEKKDVREAFYKVLEQALDQESFLACKSQD